ncbi:Cytosolic iron-sulfur assembly component 2B [Naganishia vaughanmartiniae]|uniref:Cytosolic iron-sulfur assembly component 2B n=1 Tax=Naganishia vaughanmartiniae TaxID=1424756 RepID=A0ACC2WTI7_9TREE|nr:Cytosolic iron-sulfur assembly component 2B [Naganishia vaughanmartiniae]
MSSARPLDNSNPTIIAPTAQPSTSHNFSKASQKTKLQRLWSEEGTEELDGFAVGHTVAAEDEAEDIDEQEVFDLIRSITDPEHPLTLEQLAVVSASQIKVSNKKGHERVLIEFTPTIPHCSMATLIGLTLRVRLLRALPPRYKVDIRITEGAHQSENAVNKQLNDKERVHAALENSHLLGVVEGCLATAHKRGGTIGV